MLRDLLRLVVASFACALAGCSGDERPRIPVDAGTFSACGGATLFGRPMDKTGLDASQCQPRCTCDGEVWEAPDTTQADVDALAQWTLLTPYPELTTDPYSGSTPPTGAPGDVCGVLADPPGSHGYRLVTYPTRDAAVAEGAVPTHFGACGRCSPLVDLGVYMSIPDLTAPVRDCGIKHLTGPMEAHVQCLQDLGFDRPCAQIWYWNTLHTESACGSVCWSAVNDPYNLPDGGLNPCLQCDEDQSGAVFKAVAGRTRRNTGIASAICRPCSAMQPLVHAYP